MFFGIAAICKSQTILQLWDDKTKEDAFAFLIISLDLNTDPLENVFSVLCTVAITTEISREKTI